MSDGTLFGYSTGAAEWGTSENNRKAKFYAITARGRRQLEAETENWERISSVIAACCGWNRK
jgi:DNA-binding PadR family transcriptional regulator